MSAGLTIAGLFMNTPEKIELHRKRLLINSFASIGSVFLTVFGCISLFNQRFMLGALLLTASGLTVFLSYINQRYHIDKTISKIMASVIVLLALYLVLGGGATGTGVYWSYSLTMLMVLLVGPSLSLLFMSFYLLLLAWGLFGNYNLVFPYGDANSIRIVASTVALYILIATSEWIRIRSYDDISNTSESLRHQAQTDPLTGAINRNGFDQILAQWQSRGKPAVLALLDLDHFKNINDQFGHDVGDQVLIEFTHILQKNIKGKDFLVRWGGEEFLLFLPETTLDEAYRLMEILRFATRHIPIIRDHEQIILTFSAGLAEFHGASEFAKQVKLADQQLYKAKQTGRNRILSA
jgi:diguanylate cyclase (GGDEF)-like protein